MVNSRKLRALVLAGSLAEAERVRAMHVEDDGAAARPHKLQRKKGDHPSKSIHPSGGDDSDAKNAFLEVSLDVSLQKIRQKGEKRAEETEVTPMERLLNDLRETLTQKRQTLRAFSNPYGLSRVAWRIDCDR
ncbi:unnamed protein product [Amoebophrya sp. A25]|nr:unnamed protein product [Amoebophrya sp. A25]|eukprot:GSA25T00023230001.1